jgi:hypothetical protein
MTGDYNLIALILLLLGLTWFAIRKVPVLGIVVFGLSVALTKYLSVNPLPNIAAGSSADTIINVCLWGYGALIGLLCAGMIFSKTDTRPFYQKAVSRDDTNHVYSHNADKQVRHYNPHSSDMNERQLAYRQNLRYTMHKYDRRKR